MYTKRCFEKHSCCSKQQIIFITSERKSSLDKTRKYYKEAISILLIPKPSPLKMMLHRTIRNDDF